MQPVVVDFGHQLAISGSSYVPAGVVDAPGIITKYLIYHSTGGKEWQQLGGDKEFENIRNN